MNKTTQALVLATATLFSAGLAFADEAKPAAAEGTVKCGGVNACKGHSACKTATNTCKGQNSCKGKGLSEVTAKECAAQGGKEVK